MRSVVLVATSSSEECSPDKVLGLRGINNGFGAGLMRCFFSHSFNSRPKLSILI